MFSALIAYTLTGLVVSSINHLWNAFENPFYQTSVSDLVAWTVLWPVVIVIRVLYILEKS